MVYFDESIQLFFIINFMQQLRSSILAQEDRIASRSRFGLFSQPPPIGMGDDSMYAHKLAHKGQNGKPITQPRQLLAGPNRTGKLKKSFVEVPSSIHQNDPFKQKYKEQLKYQNEKHSRGPIHEAQFKPTAYYKEELKSTYEHVDEKEFQQKTVTRDGTGKVKTQPSNIITNPTSRVENKLFKHPQYIADPFERPDEIRRQEKEVWKSKIQHDAMFKSMSHGGTNFSKNKEQYGTDDKTKQLINQKKSYAYGNFKRVHHDCRFKPAIKAQGDAIGRYPEYVRPKQRVKTEIGRKMKTEPALDDRGDWKHTYTKNTRPTPSISLMGSNCRKYL